MERGSSQHLRMPATARDDFVFDAVLKAAEQGAVSAIGQLAEAYLRAGLADLAAPWVLRLGEAASLGDEQLALRLEIALCQDDSGEIETCLPLLCHAKRRTNRIRTLLAWAEIRSHGYGPSRIKLEELTKGKLLNTAVAKFLLFAATSFNDLDLVQVVLGAIKSDDPDYSLLLCVFRR